MRGWPVRDQWKSQGKMERQFNVKDTVTDWRENNEIKVKTFRNDSPFFVVEFASLITCLMWARGLLPWRMRTLSTLFLKQGENQKRQKTIIVIGPDEGNTAKTRGMTGMLNLPLLQVFFRSARQSRNYHHIVVFKRRKSFTLPANKRNKRSRCF